jgi:pilus assembly protein CpaF
VAAGIRLVVHLARLKGGVRRVTRISEVVGVENQAYVLKDVFVFKQLGLDARGRSTGEFHATGYRPVCLERMLTSGISVPESIFGARVERPALPPRSTTSPPTA